MSSKGLALIYGLTAAVALVLTWSQNLFYFGGGARITAFPAFLKDAAVNPAARSVAFDIALVFYGAAVWMVVEGRRRRMPLVWAYVVGGLLVAISFTFPLFLAARELKGPPIEPDIEGRPSLLDGVGLGLLTAVVGAICVFVWREA